MSQSMKKKQDIQLAENLNRKMGEMDLTVSAIASRIGMNKSTLHGYRNGTVPRNVVKLKELADLLGMSMVELIFGEQPKAFSVSPKVDVDGRFEIIIRRLVD